MIWPNLTAKEDFALKKKKKILQVWEESRGEIDAQKRYKLVKSIEILVMWKQLRKNYSVESEYGNKIS